MGGRVRCVNKTLGRRVDGVVVCLAQAYPEFKYARLGSALAPPGHALARSGLDPAKSETRFGPEPVVQWRTWLFRLAIAAGEIGND